ncbi:MAG: hypothetical protein ACYS6K_22415 [Planctomycetota bacterium]|jgi:hypothetical protein
MNKIKVLLIAALLLSMAHKAQAEEGTLGATFDVTYLSRWLSKGSEAWSEDGGIFETLSLDLWGTGFGLGVTHLSATGGGWSDKQRFNYKLSYGNSLFEDQIYKTKYKINWIYENWYSRAKKKGDMQEWIVVFSWPDILAVEGLVPRYITHYVYPAGRGYNNRKISGWVHRFGLGYSLEVNELPNPLNLSGEIAFIDGYGGAVKDHDWSYATLGVSTKFAVADKLTFSPGFFYQISMDDSVIRRDVPYTKLSMTYKF